MMTRTQPSPATPSLFSFLFLFLFCLFLFFFLKWNTFLERGEERDGSHPSHKKRRERMPSFLTLNEMVPSQGNVKPIE